MVTEINGLQTLSHKAVEEFKQHFMLKMCTSTGFQGCLSAIVLAVD